MRLRFMCLLFAFICATAHAQAPEGSHAVYAERIRPIRAQIETILEEEGVPRSFVFLALAESGGDPMNVSPKGAAGLWQLMPDTAKAYGITPDERLDVDKSTRAAAKYLKHLLKMFDGDLLWTVAAYNAGGHNLKRVTGYRKGMDFSIVKTKRPAAYALARTVQRMEVEYGKWTNSDNVH